MTTTTLSPALAPQAPGIFSKERPHKHISPRAWEQSWAEDLAKIFSSDASHKSHVNRCNLATTEPRTSILSAVEVMLFNSCRAQADLARDLAQSWGEDDFEQAWRTAPCTKREDAILTALVSVCATYRVEMQRLECPDITLKQLSANDGDAFIRLWRALLSDAIPLLGSRIAEPTYVPYPPLEAIYRSMETGSTDTRLQAFIRYRRMARTEFISFVVSETFANFRGKHRELLNIVSGGEKTRWTPAEKKRAREQTALLVQLYGKKPEMEEAVQAAKKASPLIRACSYCRTPVNEFGPEQKLRECKACEKIGRKVYYCSRKCQSQDWKKGLNRPHRDTCGQERFVEGSDSSAAIPGSVICSETRIPRPDPAFKRSPALLKQTFWVETTQNPKADYTLMYDPIDRMCEIEVDDPNARRRFLIARNRAFKTGDLASVRWLYAYLATKYVREAVLLHTREQLENEYEVSLPDRPLVEDLRDPTLVQVPTEEELAWVEMAMKRERK